MDIMIASKNRRIGDLDPRRRVRSIALAGSRVEALVLSLLGVVFVGWSNGHAAPRPFPRNLAATWPGWRTESGLGITHHKGSLSGKELRGDWE